MSLLLISLDGLKDNWMLRLIPWRADKLQLSGIILPQNQPL